MEFRIRARFLRFFVLVEIWPDEKAVLERHRAMELRPVQKRYRNIVRKYHPRRVYGFATSERIFEALGRVPWCMSRMVLSAEHLGSGLLAHELFHVTSDLLRLKLGASKDRFVRAPLEEWGAKRMESMTRMFWHEFHARNGPARLRKHKREVMRNAI